MSILKAILHRWNKTTKTYDTLHPETETSQITDFDTAVNGKINTHNSSGAAHSTLFNQCEKTSSLANDIVTKLAQTTAISVISALQTNSWFGQLLKLVLNASGMKYLIAQNGYICFGSLFGGLILQWVYNTQEVVTSAAGGHGSLPIAFSVRGLCAIAVDSGAGVVPVSIGITGNNSYVFWSKFSTGGYAKAPWFYAVFIGV